MGLVVPCWSVEKFTPLAFSVAAIIFFILDIGRLHKPVKLLATPDTSGEGVVGTSEVRLAKALSGNLESAVRARRQA